MVEISAAVQPSHRNAGHGRQFFTQPFDDAIDTQLRQRAGDRQLEENELLGLSVPGLACPPPERLAADEPRLVVVRTEVSCARMRNLDRDHRNLRFEKVRSDDGGHSLISLEFQNQVDALAHQQIGVAQRFTRAVAVVDRDQMDLLASGGALQAGGHLPRGLRIGLGREAQAEGARQQRPDTAAIDSLADALHEAPAREAVQQPEDGSLAELSALDQLGQADRLALMMECFQNIARPDHRIRVASVSLHLGCPSFRIAELPQASCSLYPQTNHLNPSIIIPHRGSDYSTKKLVRKRARGHGMIRGGMAITLAFIHTGHVLIPVFAQLAKERLAGIDVFHMLDESLIRNTISGGGLSKPAIRRLLGMIESARGGGAVERPRSAHSIEPRTGDPARPRNTLAHAGWRFSIDEDSYWSRAGAFFSC